MKQQIPKRVKRNSFEWQPFSDKQLKVMTWWTDPSPYKDYDGIIADGAVRSGKTVSMAMSFVNWAMERFNDCDFAFCGKTVGSLQRNVINTLKRQLLSLDYDFEEKRTQNLIVISKGDRVNYFYCFGGKDESSQDLIQGMTLAGVLFDEVALMPQSFVAQAEARCSMSGAKYWYNCNPKAPSHWFKKEYVDIHKDKYLMYLHFTMDDNLTLSPQVKQRYERMFTGVFYQRNILGLWVTAEGKIYTAFTNDNVIPKTEWYARDDNGNYTHPLRNNISLVTMGVDFGGNKSSHAFNLTGFTRGFNELITLKEKRITEEMTPNELEQAFLEFVIECKAEYPNLLEIFCDSAEQVLIRGFKNILRINGISIAVKNARKGEIIDRIRFYSSMMNQMRYYIVGDCIETIRAFDEAVWDEDKEDVRLDDGSTNIDSLDAQEYSSEPFMKTMIDLRRKE